MSGRSTALIDGLRSFALILLPASLALGACTSERNEPDNASESEDASVETVAQGVASAAELSTLSRAIGDAQLANVLDGSGSYTLFAPTDEAFDALGESGATLLDVEQRPLLVGLLREHIVPGHITPEAIGDAIDENGGPVAMTTMGGDMLTFAREEETLTVSQDGSGTAHFIGESLQAGNGVVIPIDAILVPQNDTGPQSVDTDAQ